MTYKQKHFLINFFLFGAMFAALQLIMNLDNSSIWSFVFNFTFFGGFMSFFMNWQQKRTLTSQGIENHDDLSFNSYQKREVSTRLSFRQFEEFLVSSDKYEIKSQNQKVFVVKKKYYTSEFERKVTLTYVEGSPSKIIIENLPIAFQQTDIVNAHNSVDDMKTYLQESEQSNFI